MYGHKKIFHTKDISYCTIVPNAVCDSNCDPMQTAVLVTKQVDIFLLLLSLV